MQLFRHASLVHKLSNIDVNVAIDGEKIEIDPLSTNKSIFGKIKNITIPIRDVKACKVKTTKSNMKKQIKIKYMEGDVKKSVIIESFAFDIEEMNKKINDSLESKPR
ncbi:Target of rapamycin complex 2 subunit MAPKAP1 [Thelohanellus kitauei]|uniref:Target of rapamycin complex 2 subunit MAPKAP1 n=1 Tax=Thelohanellus kitauei TaxID=669202 RepID=A0A0C2MY12_THEKT|nr:Target of rapamycin complex 2 subunit MAPKAP1 [Thelohanellus kitauei]